MCVIIIKEETISFDIFHIHLFEIIFRIVISCISFENVCINVVCEKCFACIVCIYHIVNADVLFQSCLSYFKQKLNENDGGCYCGGGGSIVVQSSNSMNLISIHRLNRISGCLYFEWDFHSFHLDSSSISQNFIFPSRTLISSWTLKRAQTRS